jgi:hypothetical protein
MVMSTKPKNLDTYFKILGSVQDQTRFADGKAVFVAALNTLLFGFMARNFESLKPIYAACQASHVACWLLFMFFAAYVVASLLSLGFVIWAVMVSLRGTGSAKQGFLRSHRQGLRQ